MKNVEVSSKDWATIRNGSRSVELMIKNALFEVFDHADYDVEFEEISQNIINEQNRVFRVHASRIDGSRLEESKKVIENIHFIFTAKNNSLRNIFIDCVSKMRELLVLGVTPKLRTYKLEDI